MSVKRLDTVLPYVLVVAAVIGLLASWALMNDRLTLLENPDAALACDINPFVSCGAVTQTEQAAAFGVPNPLLGIVGFSVVTTIGMALLAGARLRRWFWLGLQAGVIFGFGFVVWLMQQTLQHIGVLCPYCMVVWAVMIPIFWYVTLYNLRHHLQLPQRWQPVVGFMQRHHVDILLTAYVIALVLLWWQFGDQILRVL